MDWTTFVQERQTPLFNFCLRMVGSPADAEDATQEVFVRLWQQFHRYSQDEALRPWVYRVARNVVLNLIRGQRRRRQHERAGAQTEEKAVPTPPETETLQQELLNLEAEERALIVLHYVCDTSQTEIASSLGLPRTTIQSKLRKGLEELRRRLSRTEAETSGLLMALPVAPVPATLSRNLLALEGAGATSGAITSWSLSRLALVPAVLVVTAVLGGVSGFLWGPRPDPLEQAVARSTSSDTPRRDPGSPPVLDHPSSIPPDPRLEQANRRIEELEQQLAEKEREITELAQALTGQGSPAPADNLDWDEFARCFEAYLETIESDNPLHAIVSLQSTLCFRRTFAAAREAHPDPLFTSEIAVPFFQATYGAVLDVDLRAEIEAILAAELQGYGDPHPLDRYRRRQHLLHEVRRFVATHSENTPELQLATNVIQNVFVSTPHDDEGFTLPRELSDPRHERVVRGLVDDILNEWTRYYELEPHQVPRVRPRVQQLVEAMHRNLVSAGAYDQEPETRAERDALRRSQLDVQWEEESRLVTILTPDQWQAVAARPALVLSFEPGDGMERSGGSSSPPEQGL